MSRLAATLCCALGFACDGGGEPPPETPAVASTPRGEPSWGTKPRAGCLGVAEDSTCTEDIGNAHDPRTRERACRSAGLTSPLREGETCPAHGRVGVCAIDPGADIERHLHYYASGPTAYTTDRAREECTQRQGSFRAP